MTAPRELLSVASSMVDIGDTEALDRSIVSRAYYAAFHCGLDFHETKLPSPGVEPPPEVYGSHERLIQRLLSPTCSSQEKLNSLAAGYTLRTAKIARVRADYQMGEPVKRSDALTTLGTVTALLNKLGY